MKVFTQTRTFLEGVGETGSYEATTSPEILTLLFRLSFGGTEVYATIPSSFSSQEA